MEIPYGRSRGFHYFLRDICSVIGLWDSKDCIPNNKLQSNVLSQFMDHLFGVAAYHQRYILRHNIRVIKVLLDLWKVR